MTEEDRDTLGRFKKGNTVNTKGVNGLKGVPDLTHRREYFETHYNVEDLQELIKNKKRFGALSIQDAQIVTHMAASIAGGKERGRERERFYDRKYGKPIQKSEVTGKDGKDFIPDKSAESREVVAGIAAELTRAKREGVD